MGVESGMIFELRRFGLFKFGGRYSKVYISDLCIDLWGDKI